MDLTIPRNIYAKALKLILKTKDKQRFSSKNNRIFINYSEYNDNLTIFECDPVVGENKIKDSKKVFECEMGEIKHYNDDKNWQFELEQEFEKVRK